MNDLSMYVFKDGNKFYFDPENYTDDINKNLTLKFDDGDMIKWTWEGVKMYGTIRKENYNINLFVVEKVNSIK